MITKLYEAVKIAGIATAILAVCGLLLVLALYEDCFDKNTGQTCEDYEE